VTVSIDEKARAAIARRRALGQDATLFLRVERISGRGGPLGHSDLVVGWSPRQPDRALVVRLVGDVVVLMDRRVARYTNWHDMTVSAWRLGPFEWLMIDPYVLPEMQEWESTHPVIAHRSTVVRARERCEKEEAAMTAPILVVEDDPTLVYTVERNLSVGGRDVRTATTVEEAVAVLRQELPALVVLDISLPDGCGWNVVRELRANRGEHVPVIVMSALMLDVGISRDHGAIAVFEKPFPIEDLVQLVTQIMDRPRDRTGQASLRPSLKEPLHVSEGQTGG
jgi:CheY-like chemotaxis protein